jgi:hypothetical protein
MYHLLTINDETELSSYTSCRSIAERLMNGYYLRIRESLYRIIDCEFYYNSKKHPDPYVHGHERQKESLGEWYFHGSGLGITLSSGDSCGGILIRGIANVSTRGKLPGREDCIIGPLNVCTEIFKQIGNVIASSLTFGFEKVADDQQIKTEVFSVPRVGLKDKGDDYFARPYRFISFLHLPHREIERVRDYVKQKA